jgi:hypothetical protein
MEEGKGSLLDPYWIPIGASTELRHHLFRVADDSLQAAQKEHLEAAAALEAQASDANDSRSAATAETSAAIAAAADRADAFEQVCTMCECLRVGGG